MSQKDDSENDIWEYKPLKKKKKKQESSSVAGTSAKGRCTARRTVKKKCSSSVKAAENDVTANNGDISSSVSHNLPSRLSNENSKADHETKKTEDFCPICQMPFSILVVQSQRWHVAECLDTPRDSCKECPDGLQCSSTIPNHYKRFNHTLMAHNRANGDHLSLPQQAGTSSSLPGLTTTQADDSSQDSALSIRSACPVNNQTGTPLSKCPNGLLFLRSPGPEDFKKKKGWLSSTKSQKSISASQESRAELSSTPLKMESGGQACEAKSELSPDNDDEISFSPLSELPAETEVISSEVRKALFKNDVSENEDEVSAVLFSDSFSSEDELLAEFIDNIESREARAKVVNTQLEPVNSLAPTNQLANSAVEIRRADSTDDNKETNLQSPQRIVLERLRETLINSSSGSNRVPSFETSVIPKSQTMAPQKSLSKAGQGSCLKQMDIGVFFGVKPLKEKEKEVASERNELSNHGQNSGQARQRRDRQRKTDSAADTFQVTNKNIEMVDGQGGAGRGRTREWRRKRWNRGTADGEVEELPRCPFYKKIPGTNFAIDAFRYGVIKGITAYFLTHFHSDHYGGLTKNSTFPIYCNRITGNLVKTKLRVAEQYVRILPMNTPVTVEGVQVILLDANHCPGAAMLLFFLPAGQTVLHTGDFRADPSMEDYPELLSCRVQTLYLDTTYCSPEYTFPRQQEVINFAASTAFELVTLQPRTLVVCGSYSVGKEKVFLALADVLGSKVCLSRDKYNTMCCLESEQVKQRITTDWKKAGVHVLPMMQLSFKKLQDHLSRFSDQYDQLVAFKPTGWTFSQQLQSVEDIQPEISGRISIYGIPYSEHSSFLELKRFVQWLKPLKIIPTVNNGSWSSRRAMEKYFSDWFMEAKL
ncbi:DNA cross-link repair 1A protein [Aulostomus maculatus]